MWTCVQSDSTVPRNFYFLNNRLMFDLAVPWEECSVHLFHVSS
jgi:hypothetical protein